MGDYANKNCTYISSNYLINNKNMGTAITPTIMAPELSGCGSLGGYGYDGYGNYDNEYGYESYGKGYGYGYDSYKKDSYGKGYGYDSYGYGGHDSYGKGYGYGHDSYGKGYGYEHDSYGKGYGYGHDSYSYGYDYYGNNNKYECNKCGVSSLWMLFGERHYECRDPEEKVEFIGAEFYKLYYSDGSTN